MNSTHRRIAAERRPLVAIICSVPLLAEAMSSTLEFAEVRTFAADAGDVAGLLGWLRPDALIVDSAASAEAATSFAREHGLPMLHICVRESAVRLFRGGKWEQASNGEGPTPEAIRNVVAGILFARAVPAQ
jgi:hypothetical protein